MKIPGILVDCVVVSQPEHHWQTFGTSYSAALSGELRRVRNTVPPLELTERKVIARRAAMELQPDSVVNLGIGIPEGVANVAAEEHLLDYLTLTAEPGAMGGMPAGGLDFGSALNAQAILDQPSQFDFYDGGGLDAAFLGMAQADRLGNVNVSRFGPKLAGSGGFINISQNAKRLVFTGTFTVPSRCCVQDGRLVIADGPVAPKFLADVEQRTFSGQYAAAAGQGMSLVSEDDVEAIGTEVGKRLAVAGQKVQMVINYDNFYLDPALADHYKALIRSLAERYYASATRYTTSSFMRLKLSEHLSDRGLAPHIYESRQEAMNWLGKQTPNSLLQNRPARPGTSTQRSHPGGIGRRARRPVSLCRTGQCR
ncbi:MAG: hypothetical protein ABSB76_05115 [Streptosporangiaceae bacterium]